MALSKNVFKRFLKFFRNGTGPLYPELRRVACNGGVQPGLGYSQCFQFVSPILTKWCCLPPKCKLVIKKSSFLSKETMEEEHF